MDLFGVSSGAEASQVARIHVKVWEACLALRIHLQKPLDICNKLPVIEDHQQNHQKNIGGDSEEQIRTHLSELLQLLQPAKEPRSSKKRKFDVMSAEEDEIWEHLQTVQTGLMNQWHPVVDKWHARMNYGSEKSKSKLKVLNTTIWEQIDRTLSDETVVLEKSRPLLSVSKRMGRPDVGKEVDGDDGRQSSRSSSSAARDEEVYDDLHFYSMLLKMLIQSNISSNNLSEGDAEWVALQKFRKQNQRLDVDRRASKGRKIRYVVHPKLQNFMFPVQRVANADSDSTFFTNSLFQ